MKKFLSLLFVIVFALFATVSCSLLDQGCKHENTEPLEAKKATCEEEGLTEGQKCVDCGEIVVAQETIEKLAHDLVVVPGKAATCEAAGYTEAKNCKVCKQNVVASETIPALPHTEVEKDSFDATCIADGSQGGKYCSVCFADTEPATKIPAKGHTEVELEAVAPTCTEDGLTAGIVCSDCDTVILSQKPVEKNGHTNRTIEAIAPTCYSVGYTEGVDCSVCFEVLTAPTEIEIDATAHPAENVILTTPALAATCTTEGHEDIFTCEKCLATIGGTVIEVDATAHPAESNRVLSKVEPTCSTLGYEEGLHCDACDKDIVAQVEIPMIAHDTYEFAAAIAPDCKKGELGATAHIKCNNCDYEVLPVEVQFAHNFSDWETVIEPTENTAGEEHSVCSNCGTVESNEIPALGDVKEPSIDGDGVVPVN